MTTPKGDRSAHFPAIERKHGRPVAFWLRELAALGAAKYPEQMAFLRERHGFSQAHANAVVMFARGSTSARRFDTPEALLQSIGGEREGLMRAILASVMRQHPALALVVAWNQPMLKHGKAYVFGVSAAARHLLMATFDGDPASLAAARRRGLATNRKTIQVPLDWAVDDALLDELVRARLAAIARGANAG